MFDRHEANEQFIRKELALKYYEDSIFDLYFETERGLEFYYLTRTTVEECVKMWEYVGCHADTQGPDRIIGFVVKRQKTGQVVLRGNFVTHEC